MQGRSRIAGTRKGRLRNTARGLLCSWIRLRPSEFNLTVEDGRPGSRIVEWRPFLTIAFHIGHRDLVCHGAGGEVFRDAPCGSPPVINGTGELQRSDDVGGRPTGVPRRKGLHAHQLHDDALQLLVVKRPAGSIANANPKDRVLPAHELVGEDANGTGRAVWRVAAHDVAFDEQFLSRLRVSRAGTRNSRKQTHQGYMRPSHRWQFPVSLLT